MPYAALVKQNQKAKSLDVPATGLIYSVAINKNDHAIIGGKGPSNSAYAALVNPKGHMKVIKGLPTSGAIFWVSVTKKDHYFIGGQNQDSVYAAFISADGKIKPVHNLPQGLN